MYTKPQGGAIDNMMNRLCFHWAVQLEITGDKHGFSKINCSDNFDIITSCNVTVLLIINFISYFSHINSSLNDYYVASASFSL